MRAGIQSIPRGQTDAAKAIGMTYWQTMGDIILPQAFRNMIPVLLTQTIVLFQDTSLVYVIVGDGFPRRGVEDRAARRPPGRNVSVRGRGLFHHFTRGVHSGAQAATPRRHHPLKSREVL